MSYLSVTTEKEIKVNLNGFTESFYVVYDYVESVYQLSWKYGGDFVKSNPDIFDERFEDERSAISKLISRLKEHQPTMSF